MRAESHPYVARASNFPQLKLRLKTLLDKKGSLQSRATPASKLSSSYVSLDEGFRLFSNDLDKLQVWRTALDSSQFAEDA